MGATSDPNDPATAYVCVITQQIRKEKKRKNKLHQQQHRKKIRKTSIARRPTTQRCRAT
jgi:hypothetical protein